jgi:isoquinoline 1-oxidoreductase beta subunit
VNGPKVTRRSFLEGLGAAGALILGVPAWALSPSPSASASAAAGAAGGEVFAPGIWLSIAPDGLVSVMTHRSEMGTGIRSCLPAVVADELGADYEKIQIVQAIGDEKYGSQNTDGSRSVRDFHEVMKSAGATARLLLERAAAAEWKVDAGECEVREHAVHHTSGKKLGFGELVAVARTLPMPKEAELKPRAKKDYRYIGKEFPTKDQPNIVTGAAQFGIDVKVDGMKHAAIVRPPVLGATLKSHDPAETLKVKGVEKVIVLDTPKLPVGFQALGGVAVIGADTWSVFKGKEAMKAEWDLGPNQAYNTEKYMETISAAVQTPGEVVIKRGDVDKALKSAAKRHKALYTAPHLAHATIEPPVAVAHATENGCTCWAPVQNPQAAQETVAAALGLPKEKVIVNVTLLGGGFGRKSKPDFVAEAALLSRKLGAPVKVVWTRADDLQHDYYHSNAAVYVEAGLDKKGKPTGWLQRTAFPPIPSTFDGKSKLGSDMELSLGFTDLPYAVPNLRGERCEAPAHVRIGWLRSVCNVWHAWAMSSFADELARLAGKDPLKYLLELIGPDRQIDPAADGGKYSNYDETLKDYPVDTARLKAVLERVAKESGYGRKLPKGKGLGLAVHRSFCTYVAMAVEVDVTKDGVLTVPRVDVAIDCGQAYNLDRVRSQMEGSVVFAHSLAWLGKITVADGKVEQASLHEYLIAKIHEVPREIRVHIVASEAPPAGVGEPGVPPYPPALANAIHAAIGKRVRALPLKGANLSWS